MASNATAPMTPCMPQHFLVPMFGNGTEGPGMNVYPGKSQTAHTVLGTMVVLMVFAWTTFIVELVKKIEKVYLVGGCIQMLMGTYLLTWVFFLLHPSDLTALWQYSTSDVLQLQHIAIALCLIAAGLVEVLAGYAKVLTNANWQTLWCFNLTCTGCIFITHPQHSETATLKHIMLGMSLIFASILFMIARREDFVTTRGDQSLDWSVVGAGGFYVGAGGLLMAFKEESRAMHEGQGIKCNGLYPILIGAYTLSLGTILLVLITLAHKWWRRRKLMQQMLAVNPSANAATRTKARSKSKNGRGSAEDAAEREEMIKFGQLNDERLLAPPPPDSSSSPGLQLSSLTSSNGNGNDDHHGLANGNSSSRPSSAQMNGHHRSTRPHNSLALESDEEEQVDFNAEEADAEASDGDEKLRGEVERGLADLEINL